MRGEGLRAGATGPLGIGLYRGRPPCVLLSPACGGGTGAGVVAVSGTWGCCAGAWRRCAPFGEEVLVAAIAGAPCWS